MLRLASIVAGLAAAVSLLVPQAASAQTAAGYPNRPIRLIVPVPRRAAASIRSRGCSGRN